MCKKTGREWAAVLARRRVGPGKVYNYLVVAIEQGLKGSERNGLKEGDRLRERERGGVRVGVGWGGYTRGSHAYSCERQ